MVRFAAHTRFFADNQITCSTEMQATGERLSFVPRHSKIRSSRASSTTPGLTESGSRTFVAVTRAQIRPPEAKGSVLVAAV